MPLDDLVGLVESLQERIRSHGAVLRENETRTRMALVDPLLQALGWDVSDPEVVTPEYNVEGGRADYALLRSDGHPAATVEAKKLGEQLDSHRMQMLNYSNVWGVEYAGLSDGNHWELYKVFEPGKLEERRILDVSIVDAAAHETALKLLLLWRPNLASGQPVPAGAPIAADPPLPEQLPSEVETDQAQRPATPGWVALSDYNPPRGTQCPAAIRFWDGSERKLKYWNEVLAHTIEKLYSERLLTIDDVPLQSSKRGYLVNTKPVHPTGNQFASHRSISGTPLVVNVDLTAEQIRNNTKKLLQKYGKNSAEVFLQVEQ